MTQKRNQDVGNESTRSYSIVSGAVELRIVISGDRDGDRQLDVSNFPMNELHRVAARLAELVSDLEQDDPEALEIFGVSAPTSKGDDRD
jgi:hypothetical protein